MQLIWFVIILLVCSSSADVPSFLHVCRRYDPKLTQCLTAAIESLRPALATGVPEANIPSIEPLLMPNISTRSIGVSLESEEVKTYGSSDFFVRKIRADIENQDYEISLEIPKLRIVSNYTILGRFLILPINDTGVMEIYLKDSIAKITLKGSIVHHRGVKFIKFEDCQVKIKFTKGYADLGTIFGRSSLPNFILNHTVNKHFDAFADELLPLIEGSMSVAFLNVANTIVNEYSVRELFPH